MFKVTKKGKTRLDIELSGKLNAEEMTDALDELVSKSKGIEKGKMLYDVIEFHLPSLAAIAIELSRLPSLFGLIRKFNRAAVLTDKAWIKLVSEFEGMFIPGLKIRTFDRDKKEAAEDWLSSKVS
jgi:hypothetical protein